MKEREKRMKNEKSKKKDKQVMTKIKRFKKKCLITQKESIYYKM